MIHIRYANKEDKEFWFSLDKHLSENEFEKKIRDNMGYVLLENNIPVALLRYNLFWDNTPFCTMLFVKEGKQKKSYGTLLMKFWENDIKNLGYGMCMTSTQVDEMAQHFYRKIGYEDAGALLINIPQYKQPMEMFFIKEL